MSTSALPPDPYEALGVSNDVDVDAVKGAYRKLALKHHPDRIKNPALVEQGKREFQKVQQAYELLIDPIRRQIYDTQVELAQLRKERMNKTLGERQAHIRKPRYDDGTSHPIMPGKTIFFDEEPGFLLVKPLGQGVFGAAALVICVGDGKYYVRKEELDAEERDAQRTPREVRNARRVQDVEGTAKLQGWVNYQSRSNGRSYTVSYWDYYTAGTLAELCTRSRSTQIKVAEEWLCFWARAMLEIIIGIHAQGIAHADGHLNNWFVSSRNGNNIPKIGLGDFGCSLSKESCNTQEWLDACRIDFAFVHQNLDSLLVGWPNGKLHAFVDNMEKYLERATDVGVLHKYMNIFAGSPIIGEARKTREMEQTLFKEGTPEFHSCYTLSDGEKVKLKHFLVAEVRGRRISVIKGQPREAQQRYKMIVDGGWTQRGKGAIQIER